ncbi:MAG: tRNA pseudouridine(55) synthase TruB [Gemmatimonadota bacterium]
MTAGVLPIDKPSGPTSHDIVSQARRALHERRIGHTGTLDPFASGLLLLCVAGATRLAEYLTGLDKRYDATVRLGVGTDTDDRCGVAVREDDAWRVCTEERLREALAELRGPVRQIPPAYSAKKISGERAYRMARRGEEVSLQAVDVVVHALTLRSVSLPFVELSVHCSSGTYIRALARDLGRALGTCAHLSELRRTQVGPHSVAGALTPDELDDAARVSGALIAPLRALSHLRRIELDGEALAGVRHGRPVAVGVETDDGLVAVADGADLVAVAEVRAGQLRPRKVFSW